MILEQEQRVADKMAQAPRIGCVSLSRHDPEILGIIRSRLGGLLQ